MVVRFLPRPAISYALMIAVGIVCLLPGDVHFRYIGIEVAAFGSLLVWLHYQYINRPAARDSKT